MNNIFEEPYYLIAEIGVNHGGDFDLAVQMIESVAKAGGQAAKFQTYKADKIAAVDSPSYWDRNEEPTETQHKLFQKYDSFDKDHYEELAKACTRNNIDFLSTPFDTDCIDWLMPLMPYAKIASADITNHLLLEEVAKHKKITFMSVGAANDEEIAESTELLLKSGVPQVVLLHCMLLYPTPIQNAFLSNIQTLQNKFGNKKVQIGYSDHVKSDASYNDQIIAAYAMGARVIEKHFTYDKTLPGNDHYHALDEADMLNLTERLSNLNQLLGSKDSFDTDALDLQALAIKNARRSLYFTKDLPAGHVLSKEDLIAKRPGFGISPSKISLVLGKKLVHQVNIDGLLDENHLV